MVAAVSGACAAASGPGYRDAPDAGRTVVMATTIDRYHSAAGDEDVVLAPLPQAEAPRAWVRKADGSFAMVEYGGESRPGVYPLHFPDGQMYVAYRAQFVVGALGDVDFGRSHVGRADATLADPDTFLSLSGDGLLPWWFGVDALLFVCPNAGAMQLEYASPGLPRTNETALAGFDLSWHQSGLVSAAHGDEAWVLQQRISRDDNVYYAHYPRAMHLTGIEQGDGAVTPVSGTFVEGVRASLDVDLRLAAFAVAGRAGTPTLTFDLPQAWVKLRRFGQNDAADSFDDVVDIFGFDSASDQSLSFDYQNPYPPEWPEVLEVSLAALAGYRLDGSFDSLAGVAVVRLVVPLAAAEAAPVVPRVGPPRRLRLDGAAALTGLSTVAETPLVEWDAPALGSADGYIVELMRLEQHDGLTFDTSVARFYTVATSVQLVPGLIEPGTVYFLRVTALSGEGVDVLHAPNRVSGSYGSADALTGVFHR